MCIKVVESDRVLINTSSSNGYNQPTRLMESVHNVRCHGTFTLHRNRTLKAVEKPICDAHLIARRIRGLGQANIPCSSP